MTHPTPAGGGARILSLGDSYTIGESVSSDDRWPVVLVSLLRARGTEISDPQIIARTGWTTRDLGAAIDDARPRGPFDLVTLLIGVNDQYRGRSPEEYRPQFRLVLSRAMTQAGKRPESVVVISIPDWGVTPHAQGRDRRKIAAEIDAFNAVNRDEALAAGTHYADITALSRLAATNRDLVAADGLHPSAAMYVQWAHAILPLAAQVLSHRVTRPPAR
jgi:lysophospholipase L1-like esterase